MALRVSPFLAAGLLAALLASCSRFDRAERPAWRNQAEESCLARHEVEATALLQPARAIDGPGICGLNHPFRVYALAGGTVRLDTASLLDCSMIPMLDTWIKDVVQPDAQARFGQKVVQIDTMGTYSCRGINNQSGAGLSEHAFANAIDVGGFVLADGRKISVMRGWSGPDPQESAFLHDAHAGACTYFTTVLGPGYNVFHYNHVHMDLAMHGNTSRGPRRYCKPVPSETPVAAPRQDNLPDPPPIEEELDMAQTPLPPAALAGGGQRTFVASVPETAPVYRPRAMAARPVSVVTMAPLPHVTAAPLALLPMPRRDADPAALDLQQAGGESPPPEAMPDETDVTSRIGGAPPE